MTTATKDERPWPQRAWDALHFLMDTGEWFCADDLIDLVGLPDPKHRPNGRNSTIGALFREASQMGLIYSNDRIVRSRRPERHGGMQRLWRGVG